MLARVDALAALAADLGVRIMIDAEHSYFQPAIDHVTLQLQRRYNTNKDRALVYNTYQCYLKDTPRKLAKHIALAEREGWHFACKLVRGAYLHLERERSATLGVDDPVQHHFHITGRDRSRRTGGVALVGRVAVAVGAFRSHSVVDRGHHRPRTYRSQKLLRCCLVVVLR